VEHQADLTDAEAAALGPVLRLASQALIRAVAPAKVYAASFGKLVRHLHFFVLPRTPDMPAHGLDVLNALVRERRWACSDAEAVAIAERIRAELAGIPGNTDPGVGRSGISLHGGDADQPRRRGDDD
jgi:diadenosine tetraphosphate (Ap4A) HIT family hydrolase